MSPAVTSPDPQTPANPTRRRLMTLLKVGVTVVGLGLVWRNLDVAAILRVIGQVQPGWMAAGAALMILSLIVRAYRWHLILHGVGSAIRFGRLVELYLIGSFFNAFLPSGLGGDVVRAAEAAQDVDAEIAVSTVFIDRLSGLMALFVMALAVLPFRPAEFPPRLAWSIGVLCGVGLLAGLILINGRFVHAAVRLLPPRVRALGDNFLDRLAAAIGRCGWRTLAGALLVSVLFNLMQVAWWAITSRALGLTIPFGYYLLVVPVMAIALLVPSIGGLGVRENVAPLLFSGTGISPEQAVALTLLVFGLERVASLLGAPVYLLGSFRRGQAPEADEPLHHA